MGTIVKWAKPVLDVVGTVFPPARIVTMPLSIGLSTANGLSQAQYAESVIDARNQSAGINA